MRFRQIIEFTTTRIDEFDARFDEWMRTSAGSRIPHRAVLCADCDAPGVYLLTVEFASYEQAMENSTRPQTQEFAGLLFGLSDSPPAFRNLDVRREEDL